MSDRARKSQNLMRKPVASHLLLLQYHSAEPGPNIQVPKNPEILGKPKGGV